MSERLFIRLRDLQDGPGEEFVEIEDSSGRSVRVPSLRNEQARERTIGPLYQADSRVKLAKDRKNRIYIAGPMRGYEGHNFPSFNNAAARLRAIGYEVVNPAEHGIVPNATVEDYLRYDLAKLADCEAIALLPGWHESEGAMFEFSVAQKLGFEFVVMEHLDQYLGKPDPDATSANPKN